jgi:hypothetical protein
MDLIISVKLAGISYLKKILKYLKITVALWKGY